MKMKRVRYRLRPAYLIAFVWLVSVPPAAGQAGPDAPSHLMCELMARPELAVLRDRQPEFGWAVNSSLVNDVQSAYQIVVASRRETLEKNVGDLWDTGKTPSARSIDIEYAGDPLSPNETYFWKVRIWNRNGEQFL